MVVYAFGACISVAAKVHVIDRNPSGRPLMSIQPLTNLDFSVPAIDIFGCGRDGIQPPAPKHLIHSCYSLLMKTPSAGKHDLGIRFFHEFLQLRHATLGESFLSRIRVQHAINIEKDDRSRS